ISFGNVKTNNRQGSCDWEATYTFGNTGRKVHNVIHAEFVFKEGLIARHDDTFNFHKWASQALGLTGKLLGWTRFLEQKVQTQANDSLQKFIQQTKTN
ncbi:MAG: nuclear transport factor 2 family protein, partial [Runella slithyformis]